MKNVLIVGAGVSGGIVGRDLLKGGIYRLVGYLDDDPGKEGLELCGVLVLGSTDLLPGVIFEYAVSSVIISMPSATGFRIYNILNKLVDLSLEIKIVPGFYHILERDMKINYPIRGLGLVDFLRKPKITLDIDRISSVLSGKRVLVTGAGGSIGREISMLVASVGPGELVLLGRGENSIFDVYNDLKISYSGFSLEYSIVNIVDYSLLEGVFKRYRPEVIFHAAAHKHVGFMESHVKEAFHNNVIGSFNLMSLSYLCGVERFVLVSTDKAVSPRSVMGATKCVVEQIMLSYGDLGATIFSAVRFGNVLGSRGSVVPLFRKQIERGGPVTVTDREVSRYFMTIAEAAQLVIQSCAISCGKEIFVLDMGESVKIYDLAKLLVQIYKPNLGKEVEIVFTGLRDGEKLDEELWTSLEGKTLSVSKGVYVLQLGMPSDRFFELLDYMVCNFARLGEDSLRDLLFELVSL